MSEPSRTAPARILLAGNPNAGKTTLFNALTGARARVGNYPGVTVDRRAATWRLPNGAAELVDLPGTYSLTARSAEEEVAISSVLGRDGRHPSAVLVVVDATSLRRGLYYALQILETGVPAVVALSLADEAKTLGIHIDVEALSRAMRVPVIATSAAKREGLSELAAAVDAVLAAPTPVPEPELALPSDLTGALDRLLPSMTDFGARSPRMARALARWALLSIDEDDQLADVPAELRSLVVSTRAQLLKAGTNPDLAIVSARFAIVDRWAQVAIGDARTVRKKTELADRWLTHPVVGLGVFAVVMAVVFQALFSWSEPVVGVIEKVVEAAQALILGVMSAGPLRDLLVDGVIAGVGNVVVFVPQIALLFLFITLLEDSGYLARVAFVIDRLMAGVGLHGKAFVPLLSGFACAVPAVLSTRTIEDRRDRLVTMLALPLMSCSARLPVYVLVVATVFSHQDNFLGFLSTGAVVLFSLYALSVVGTLGAAAVMRRTVLPGPRPTLVLELPPYRRPLARNVGRAVWDRVRTFLVEAGTTILALTIVLWALLNYPKSDAIEHAFETERTTIEATFADGGARDEALAELEVRTASQRLEASALGRVGKAIEPALAPLGFDWRIDVGILGAFAAREVFVSTLGIVFGIGESDETSEPLRATLRRATRPDGSRLFDVPTGVSLLVFFVFACQCMSTVAVVKREAGGWGWALFMVAYMTVLAYVAAFVAKAIAAFVVGHG